MKKLDKKAKKSSSRYGVFNGNVIENDLVISETEFKIEPYSDESITITKMNVSEKKGKTNEIQGKAKRRSKNIIFKIIATIIIATAIIGGIIFLGLNA